MVELTLVLGSTSDWKNEEINIQGQLEELTRLHDDLEVRVEFASAHNTPDRVPLALGRSKVRPSGAGMSAALPGIIEAVHGNLYNVSVGIPLSDKVWKGLPAFYSIAEMPPNNPVLCAGIDNVKAGISMAYQLEKGLGRVVLLRLTSDTAAYEKMKGKFADVLGKDIISDNARFVDAGKFTHVRPSHHVPEEAKGSLVVSLGSSCDMKECSAFDELDRVVAETGGAHICLNSGTNLTPDYAYQFASQFSNSKATGTMAVGSAGYTNAAQFAARAMGWSDAISNIGAIKRKKAASLYDAPGYHVHCGKTEKIEQPQQESLLPE